MTIKPKQQEGALPPTPKRDDLTYSSYLAIEELLSLQRPISEPAHHDEHLFILIHQVYELWFRQLLHELDAALQAFTTDRVLVAHKIFRRVSTIQRVLNLQVSVLETMSPEDFAGFRDRLNPASGFQSSQFREVEFLSGIKDRRYLRFHQNDPDTLARLERRLNAPTLYDAFVGVLQRRGFDVASVAPEPDTPDSARLVAALKQIYERSEDHYDLYLMCEYLIEYDELFQLWRFAHVKMVERTIGVKRGTGGSSGAKYLWATLTKRFFHELWDVRNHLGLGGYGA